MATLSGQARKIVAIILLVASIGALFAVVVLPIMTLYQSRALELAERHEQAQQFRAVGMRKDMLGVALSDRQTQLESTEFLLQEPKSPLATAALQRRVDAIVERAGGTVSSTRVLPDTEHGEFTEVGITVRFASPTVALQRILYGLESSVPWVMLDKITIRSRGDTNLKQNAALDIQLNVTGLISADKT